MSDTPRTDACWDDKSCNIFIHARQLERELAEARKDAANQRRLADLALAHRDVIIAERDTLAEALEMVATHTYAEGQCDNGYSPQYVAKQALSAVKGGSDD